MTPAEDAALVAGLIAGVGMWVRLRARTYRRPSETPRRTVDPWWVLLAAPVLSLAWGYALAPALPIWPAALAVGLTWVAAAETDLDVHRLPDSITLTTWAVYALVLVIAALLGDMPSHRVAVAFGSSSLLSGCAFILGLATGQIGLGDVKLLAVVGLVLGSVSGMWVLYALLLASVIGLLAASLAVLRGSGASARLAAGPGIILAAALTPLLGRLLP